MKTIRTSLIVVYMIILALTSTAQMVQAMEAYSVTVRIPVSQVVDGKGIPDKAVVDYRLEAVDNAPVPEDPDGSSLRLRGTSTGEFGEMTYTVPGVYSYRVTRRAAKVDGYTADECGYDVVVAALSDGSVKVVCKRDDEDGKSGEIVFHDKYRTSIIAPETGDDIILLGLVSGAGIIAAVALVLLIRKRTA